LAKLKKGEFSMTDLRKSRKLIIIIGFVVLVVITNLIRVYIVNTTMKQGINAYIQEYNDIAIKYYTRAINFSLWDKEKKADSFLWRGKAYYEKEDYNQALTEFTKAIELRNNDYPYYNWRARTHNKLGNFKLAIEDFSKLIELTEFEKRDNWDKYLERAESYSLNKEYNLAIADYEKAIIILDKSINSQNISVESINDIKKKRDDTIKSIDNIKRFIEYKNNNPEKDITYLKWMAIEWLFGGEK